MPTARARWQRAVVALFVVVAYLVLAGYYEGQARQLRGVVARLDRDAWRACEARALNIAETQNLRSQLVAHDPSLAPIYDRHRLVVPDCGEMP